MTDEQQQHEPPAPNTREDLLHRARLLAISLREAPTRSLTRVHHDELRHLDCVTVPARTRCEHCPEECDVEGCDAPGCNGQVATVSPWRSLKDDPPTKDTNFVVRDNAEPDEYTSYDTGLFNGSSMVTRSGTGIDCYVQWMEIPL